MYCNFRVNYNNMIGNVDISRFRITLATLWIILIDNE